MIEKLYKTKEFINGSRLPKVLCIYIYIYGHFYSDLHYKRYDIFSFKVD